MSDPVEISRDHLAVLLWFAKHGDVACSQRRLRRGFRKVAVCSDHDVRESGCFSCEAFSAAEKALDA